MLIEFHDSLAFFRGGFELRERARLLTGFRSIDLELEYQNYTHSGKVLDGFEHRTSPLKCVKLSPKIAQSRENRILRLDKSEGEFERLPNKQLANSFCELKFKLISAQIDSH